MSEWQPIETAPKDGSRVLGFEHGYLINITWFDVEHDSGVGGWRNYRHGWLPTHWQPLPEPPKEQS